LPAATAGPPPPWSVPLERSLLPDVEEADDQYADEDQHLDEPEQPQLAERHAPGNQEHRLEVENDEQDRDDVELDREALARVPERHHPGLVRRLLRRRRPEGAEEMRCDNHPHRVYEGNGGKDQDRHVRLEHRSPSRTL